MKHLLIACTLLLSASIASAQDKPNLVAVPDALLMECLEGKGFANTEKPFDRFPLAAKEVLPEKVWNASRHSTGMAFAFTTDAKELNITWGIPGSANLAFTHMSASGVSGIDVYQRLNGTWCSIVHGRPHKHTNTVSIAITPKAETLVYLPLYNPTVLFELKLPKGQTIAPIASRKVKLPVVIYGTSITQGACASRPGLAYTAIVGRIAETPIVNLGFAGAARMEPELAQQLIQIPASLYVLDCLWNMSDQLVSSNVEPFLEIIKAARPNTPILICEQCDRDDRQTSRSKLLAGIYAKLKKADPVKWANLHYLPAKGMLGTDGEATVDNTHPNDLGMMRQGQIFGPAIAKLLQPAP